MDAPILVMLAGPNGAGKSTFYEAHLASLALPFLNADHLARETGLDAYTAADTVASIRDLWIEERKSFVVETVFSDPVGEKVAVLERAAAIGFDVSLIYIGIDSCDLSRRRVQARVQAGGHDVPEEKLADRYIRSLQDLQRALASLPRVLIYDNSSFQTPYRFVAEFRLGNQVRSGKFAMPRWVEELVD